MAVLASAGACLYFVLWSYFFASVLQVGRLLQMRFCWYLVFGRGLLLLVGDPCAFAVGKQHCHLLVPALPAVQCLLGIQRGP